MRTLSAKKILKLLFFITTFFFIAISLLSYIGYVWLQSRPYAEHVMRSRDILYRINRIIDREYRNAHWHCPALASPNFDDRKGTVIEYVILHFTGSEAPHSAIYWMSNYASKVSSHYVIEQDGSCLQLVPEKKNAWHAGKSKWKNFKNLNERSIGIELVNNGYEAYTPEQMTRLSALLKDIVQRYRLPPENILAHSDIQPDTKKDPGEFFPWKQLAENGLSVWPKPLNIDPNYLPLRLGDSGSKVASLKKRLRQFGYGLTSDDVINRDTQDVIIAFQRRFRPENINGIWDAECDALLNGLL